MKGDTDIMDYKLGDSKVGGHNCFSVYFPTVDLTVDISKGFGPRILSLTGGKIRENPFFVDTDDPLKARGGWKLRGGGRVWAGRSPLADETEESYAEDNYSCASVHTVKSLECMGEKAALFEIRRGFRLALSTSGVLEVTTIVENTSDMLWSGFAWALTCIDPQGKTFAVPLGTNDNWNQLLAIPVPNWGGGHTSRWPDSQFQDQSEGYLQVVKPDGHESKRIYGAYRGWIGCQTADYSFFKVIPFDPNRIEQYPSQCNAAFYLGPDAFMVEMESMGPTTRLNPGQRLEHREIWVVTDSIPWKEVALIEEILAPHIEAVNA